MTAPTMSYGDGWLEDFIEFWDETYESEATAQGGAGKDTTIDSVRTEADDTWNGYWIKFLSGSNAGEHRLITDFDQGTTTFTHEAFDNRTEDGDEYILSKYVTTLSAMATGDIDLDEDNPEDVLELEGVFDLAGEEYAYLEYDLPTNLDTDVYTECLVRFKTEADLDKAHAYIVLIFTVGSQTIDLGETDTWDTISTAITAHKTLDKVRVYIYKGTTDQGTFSVWYDFIKIHKGTFTFPHLSRDGKSGGVYPSFEVEDIETRIPGRQLNYIEPEGLARIMITLKGDMLQGESWGTPFGQFFLDVLRNDAWSWFTSDRGNFKVRIARFQPNQSVESGAVADFDLVLKVFSHSDLGDSIWDGVTGWLGV